MSTESQYTAQEKYRKSEKGKAAIKRYELKEKERLQAYRQQYNKEKRERERKNEEYFETQTVKYRRKYNTQHLPKDEPMSDEERVRWCRYINDKWCGGNDI